MTLVLEFDRTHNELTAPRIPIYAHTISSEACLIYWKDTQSSPC